MDTLHYLFSAILNGGAATCATVLAGVATLLIIIMKVMGKK